jgi:hypothetical protein
MEATKGMATTYKEPYTKLGDFIVEPRIHMITVLNLNNKTKALKERIDTFVSHRSYGIIDLEKAETVKKLPETIKIIANAIYKNIGERLINGPINTDEELVAFERFIDFIKVMITQLHQTPIETMRVDDESFANIMAMFPERGKTKEEVIENMIEFMALGIEAEQLEVAMQA